jgi:copper chaperone CopZ
MKFKSALIAAWCAVLFLSIGRTVLAADVEKADEVRQPHTPALIFYLSGAENQKDADAIRASVQKLKSAATINVNTNRSYACIRFDSHVVSYHQVAQAIAEAGKTLGKSYNPYLIFSVLEYGRSNNAAKVDAIFAGKRLNTRVNVKPLDKNKGELVFISCR